MMVLLLGEKSNDKVAFSSNMIAQGVDPTYRMKERESIGET